MNTQEIVDIKQFVDEYQFFKTTLLDRGFNIPEINIVQLFDIYILNRR